MMFGFGGGRKDPVADFWDWFAANHRAIERDAHAVSNSTPASALIVRQLGERFARVCPDISHEIGITADGLVELVISADGVRAVFPAVSALIGAAPPLPGFKFTAFRPRTGPVVLEMHGKAVGFEKVRFKAYPEGDRLGLDLFIDVDAPLDEVRGIGFILLDTALGEYDVGVGIGSIEFQVGAPDDARPLEELAAAFDAFRAQTVH